jgi:hypothetical protein
MKSALLLGNGVNRLSKAMDLSGLMHFLATGGMQKTRKPGGELLSWPLEFERIYSEKNKNQNLKAVSKSDLKKKIREWLKKSLSSVNEWSLLSEFTSLPVKHILTTNYDYNLEKAVNPHFNRKKSPEKTKQKLYSLYRKIMPDGQPSSEATKVVWHIHGEAEAPESICLGYEHYCGQLAAMRQLLTQPESKTTPQYQVGLPKKTYLNQFLGNRDQEPDSWLTLFFTHHIYIVGLSLSFMEIDLWWLLTYRRQYQIENPQEPKNKIVYFCHSGHEPEAEISTLMSAMGLEIKAVGSKEEDRCAFYRRALKSVKNSLK